MTATGGVRYNERVLVVGPTESGKSELLNVLFSQFQCQRLLFDTKGHEWTIAGVEPVSDPASIDWSQPIIHYVTAGTELGEVTEVFEQCCGRRDLVVCVHELNDLSAYSTNKTPEVVNRYLSQGGANGRGLLGATQMPVDMPKRARSEVQHVFTLAPPIDEDHLKVVCRIVGGIGAPEMREEIEAVQREHGDHAFVHWPKGALQEPVAYPPLPDWMLEQSIVKRRRPHARERSG
jgi:hypothetical protein